MLFTYLLPSVVLVLPLYLAMVKAGIANSLFSLVIAYTTFALPYALWLLRSFMASLPEELEWAALVDGASRIGAFVDVVLPQALPGIISTALFTFIVAWNEYFYALILVNTDEARPLTTGVITMLVTSFNIEWSLLMAASVAMSLPLIIIFVFLQGYLVKGLRRHGDQGLGQGTEMGSDGGITLNKLRKQFGAIAAVNDLDLDIGAGEFVSLLGPSGCGKTTTLRMLAGLDFPDQRDDQLRRARRQRPRAGKARHRHGVPVLCALSAYDGRGEHRLSPAEARRAEGRAAGEGRGRRPPASARALLTRKPRQLSGGQQQRVALGRALVREPSVFLLDEPLSNLDAKLRAHMRAELIELHRKIGKTMVYVTHDQLEAMTMSSRIAVMRGGLLQQFGTPAEIYERPANVFVADFIGTPVDDIARRRAPLERRCSPRPVSVRSPSLCPATM